MPSPLAHSFCGFVLLQDIKEHLFSNRIYAASFVVFLSNFPDYDYLLGLFKGDLMGSHRLVTHTLLFPFVVGALVGGGALLFRKKFLPFFSLATALVGIHLLLDYLSYDYNPANGIGIPLFQPLSSKFHNFLVHPIASRIMGDSPALLAIFVNDLYYMAIFAGLILWRSRNKRSKTKEKE